MERVPFGKFGFIHKAAYDGFLLHVPKMLGCALLLFGIGANLSHFKQERASSYKDIEMMFNAWEGKRDEHLKKFQKLLQKRPSLKAKYEGRTVQRLMGSVEREEASYFVDLIKKRIALFPSYHAAFSSSSLLIGQKQFKEALSHTILLKETLDQDTTLWNQEDREYADLLYAYNLLRICFLQKELGNPSLEKSAWQDFKKYMQWLPQDHSQRQIHKGAYKLLMKNFEKEDLSLKDYILYREASLSE
ncbi:hypothetical protein [Rhabdochlamydiaceae symbiont of Dictyostelium giganteum]|uniref:hypothetical protein n=1 Tax=Rhabdochlamydiaceae symbiont of Dictyostelium giganteum TaxID=3342349 RepID=UPI00384FABBA